MESSIGFGEERCVKRVRAIFSASNLIKMNVGYEKLYVSWEKDGKKYYCFHPWVKEVLREHKLLKRLGKKYLK